MRTLKEMLFIITLLFFAACSKDGGDADSGSGSGSDDPKIVAKGLGLSKERPEGTVYKLPAGVEFVSEKVLGYDSNKCLCGTKQKECAKGAGHLVLLCLQLRNTTNKPITVTFPAGLLFISIDTETQNGLLIQVETFEIPANEVGQFKFSMFCANVDRDSSKAGDEYILGPVTQYPPLLDLITRVKNKQLLDLSAVGVIQNLVWRITEGVELSQRWIDVINNEIPNK